MTDIPPNGDGLSAGQGAGQSQDYLRPVRVVSEPYIYNNINSIRYILYVRRFVDYEMVAYMIKAPPTMAGPALYLHGI